MKKLYLFLSTLFITQFISICLYNPAYSDPLKIALLLDRGGKDDKSFNAAAYRGALEAQQKFDMQLKTIEASDDSFFEPAMRSFITKKFDLIIAIGVAQSEVVKKLSKEFPQQKFLIIDAKVESPNVFSALFSEHEGSFLMGYIAAMKSKSKKIGFIGGVDIPLIRRFEKAYIQGAKTANSKIQVLTHYVGVTSEAWNNPTKAKELAKNQYQNGADVIFIAAGASNNGAFNAAEENMKFAIGVDSNQNFIKPGRILTSMLKRVDVAVFQAVERLSKQQFKGDIQVGGLKEGLIDWAKDKYNDKLFTKTEIQQIEKIKQSLIKGQIKPVDYYLMQAKK